MLRTNTIHKGPQTNIPKNVGSIKTWTAKITNRHLVLQAEYCNADRTTWTLTLQDINTTPKELKTERDCSHRQLFSFSRNTISTAVFCLQNLICQYMLPELYLLWYFVLAKEQVGIKDRWPDGYERSGFQCRTQTLQAAQLRLFVCFF